MHMLITALRTLVLYAVVAASMRIMGKRQIGQLEPHELVVMILISELAAIPIQEENISLFHGLLPILLLVGLELLLSVALLKSIRLRRLVCGRPSVIIHNGVLLRKEIAKSRITVDEIVEELRIKGITDIATIQYAIMETNGQLSVLLYPEFRPAESGQLQLTAEDKGLPIIVLNDGRWLDDNLQSRGLSRKFILKELEKQGFSHINDVYVAMVDELNGVYVSGRQH